MPLRLDSAQADFEQLFSDLLGAKRESSKDVNDIVATIIADVRARGDVAVAELTNRFDRTSLTPDSLAFGADEIAAAAAAVEPTVHAAAAMEAATMPVEAMAVAVTVTEAQVDVRPVAVAVVRTMAPAPAMTC